MPNRADIPFPYKHSQDLVDMLDSLSRQDAEGPVHPVPSSGAIYIHGDATIEGLVNPVPSSGTIHIYGNAKIVALPAGELRITKSEGEAEASNEEPQTPVDSPRLRTRTSPKTVTDPGGIHQHPIPLNQGIETESRAPTTLQQTTASFIPTDKTEYESRVGEIDDVQIPTLENLKLWIWLVAIILMEKCKIIFKFLHRRSQIW
jgi:hypothetical protein